MGWPLFLLVSLRRLRASYSTDKELCHDRAQPQNLAVINVDIGRDVFQIVGLMSMARLFRAAISSAWL
jgi:hypothetical protein